MKRKKFQMERKKLRWAKMGKVEGFIKPVETQMASSLQGLGKGKDFTFYVFPFILHHCRGWRVKILRFMFFLLILHPCRGWRVNTFFPSFLSLQELESQDFTFFHFIYLWGWRVKILRSMFFSPSFYIPAGAGG